MLQHIQQQQVLVTTHLKVQLAIQVLPMDLDRRVYRMDTELIDNGNSTPLPCQLGGNSPGTGADVENRRPFRDSVDCVGVATRVPQFEIVMRVSARPGVKTSLIQNPGAVQRILERHQHYILGVLEAVDAADFVSVVRWNWKFDDPRPRV